MGREEHQQEERVGRKRRGVQEEEARKAGCRGDAMKETEDEMREAK